MAKRFLGVCSVALLLIGGVQEGDCMRAKGQPRSNPADLKAKVSVMLDVNFDGSSIGTMNLLKEDNTPTDENDRTLNFKINSKSGNYKLRLIGSGGLEWKTNHWEMKNSSSENVIAIQFDFYDGENGKTEDLGLETNISSAKTGDCKIVGMVTDVDGDTISGEYKGKISIEIVAA